MIQQSNVNSQDDAETNAAMDLRNFNDLGYRKARHNDTITLPAFGAMNQ